MFDSIRIRYELDHVMQLVSYYAGFDNTLVEAAKYGLEKFNEYNNYMKGNDIHYIASLDPRIKCQWLWKNVNDVEGIIKRIRTFLKSVYPPEPELPPHENDRIHRSLEYRFLEEFETTTTIGNSTDIDRYLNAPSIAFKLNEADDQTLWTLNWWDSKKYEFPCMTQAARDYLPIPASESDS